MSFRPAARDIGEDRQDRNLVIVVPEDVRIMPEAGGRQKSATVRRAGERAPSIRADRAARESKRAYNTTGVPSVMTRTFFSMPCSRAQASKRAGGSSSGS